MLITIEEFNKELNNPPHRKQNIIFIGMSGAGKTHQSKLVADRFSYDRFEFDELIGASSELKSLLSKQTGKDEAEKMGRYFGMPWTPGFSEREEKFLQIERNIMKRSTDVRGHIFDLSGSAIYHPEQMQEISQTGIVIYLETSLSTRQAMFENFIANPKPVCWQGVYRIEGDETQEEALERCYPILLDTRAELYERWADITLPYEVHKGTSNPDQFRRELESFLSSDVARA